VNLLRHQVALRFAEAEIVAVDVEPDVGVSGPGGFVDVGALLEQRAFGVPELGCESVASPDRRACLVRSWDTRVGSSC